MPKTLARNKKASEGRLSATWLKCLGKTLAAIILFSLTLLLFAESSEARYTPWWAKRVYTLQLTVSYMYDSEWGDRPNAINYKNTRFIQDYRFRHTGYVVDPRLMNYEAGVRFQDRSILEGNSDGYSVTGIDVKLTLFEGINRERGLKMWKYVPSPITLRYSLDLFDDGNRAQSYSVSMYYSRPGTLRVFSNKKIIYYDDGTNNNINIRRNLNGNRYRYKYDGSNYNVNGNGNTESNSNNNGNSNWNRAGYMNRNRNINQNRNLNSNMNVNMNADGNLDNSNWNRGGNSNWNRSGNSNWNRNGNSNWNRNGNSNWNRNWNRNWNYNYNKDYGKRAPGKGLFSFAFPTFSLDFTRNTSTDGHDSTLANVRMSIDNSFRKDTHYRSSYKLNYHYREGTHINKSQKYTLTAVHEWVRFRITNLFNYIIEEPGESYYAESSLNYANEFKIKEQPVPYDIGITGNYASTPDRNDWWYISGYIRMSADKSKKLMPGLVVTSRINARYWRKQNKGGQGVDVYNIGIQERLVSRQLRNMTLYGNLSYSYSESGVPARASGRAVYRKSKRLILYAGGDVGGFYRQEHRGVAYSYKIYFGGNYQIRANLKYNGEISYNNESSENGRSYSFNTLVVKNELSWLINSRSNLDASARYENGDQYRYMNLSMQYRNRIHARGSIFIGAGITKRNDCDAFKQVTVGYNMSYRKISFNATYRLRMWGGNLTDHKLTVRVSRTFGRAFRKLW